MIDGEQFESPDGILDFGRHHVDQYFSSEVRQRRDAFTLEERNQFFQMLTDHAGILNKLLDTHTHPIHEHVLRMNPDYVPVEYPEGFFEGDAEMIKQYDEWKALG